MHLAPALLSPVTPFQLSVIAAWLLLVGAIAEGIRRITGRSSELTRKIVHIGSGHVILLAWWLGVPTWLGLVASACFSMVALLSHRYPLIPGIDSVGRQSQGTFFYAISFGILIAWFWPLALPQYAVLGIMIMTWGDGLAALVGQRWGQHPYQIWGMQKSWEGTGTMLIVSGLVSLVVLASLQGVSMATGGIAIAVAMTATLLEAFSKFGLDNLTVPCTSAALAFWLMTW